MGCIPPCTRQQSLLYKTKMLATLCLPSSVKLACSVAEVVEGKRMGQITAGKMSRCTLAWFGGSTSKALGVNTLLTEQGYQLCSLKALQLSCHTPHSPQVNFMCTDLRRALAWSGGFGPSGGVGCRGNCGSTEGRLSSAAELSSPPWDVAGLGTGP